MAPHPVELDTLFEQVDGWFADFTAHEPISHYARVRKKTCAAKKSGSTNRKPTLDSLAKDLEFLLEQSDAEEASPQTTKTHDNLGVFHFNICNDDELALLDDSIGSCCVTYGEIKDEDAMNWTSVDISGGREYSVVMRTLDSPKSFNNLHEDSNRNPSNKHENNDLKVQAQMPPDHDYLPKPRAKSLELDNQYLSSVRSKQMNISVLNTGVIKRFARFSPKFRELSSRNDRSLIAINNSQ